ncbi:Uncharacterized protein OBRU01_21589 [Operophtera brumata]|uniref:Uncharacterized protein n=1 Tax=Operophtera brumata TaxID=104452 RepID=A0A0L7KT16_OPEBR|nr:Uncharacterized protein OBRU01_21589 [Operophtera brumata]
MWVCFACFSFKCIKKKFKVKDPTGKTVHLANHQLPVTVVQGSGGYHSVAIDANTHNLFEEIPSLGICGDIVMAEASEAAQPVPNFRVLPQHTRATRALCGYFGPIGARKEEVCILLQSIGVRDNGFDETIGGTRLNINLLQKVSDYFSGSSTFRNEKVELDALTGEGDGVQLIKSIPTDENVHTTARWTNLFIRPNSSNASPVTTFGASYLMGYQLQKDAIAGNNANWCCVEQIAAANPWNIPAAWIANRNARRVLPPGLGIERFVSISDSQRNRTNAICSTCSKHLDFGCAQISEAGWRKLGSDRRNAWKCSSCRNHSPRPASSPVPSASPVPYSFEDIIVPTRRPPDALRGHQIY